MANPWLTSDDLIETVKRKISFPVSQNTFSDTDILAFANEEMFISQVPSIMVYHEEYFVTTTGVPLQPNQSIYTIPNRAIGLRLRDVFWGDGAILPGAPYGNLFEMTRVNPDDAAFFQRNIGANAAIHKFYIQGNTIRLLPTVTSNPTGFIVFMYFLRPNQLVQNNRAATITNFTQNITVNNSFINDNDTITIGNFYQQSITIPNFFTENPAGNIYSFNQPNNLGGTTFTAKTVLGGTITNIAIGENTYITSANHGLTTGQIVNITGSDSIPSIDGSYSVSVIDNNVFSVNANVTSAGTAGSFTSPNQFLIDISSIATAQNLNNSIINLGIVMSSSVGSPATNIVTYNYSDRNVFALTNNAKAFTIPASLGVQFDQIPANIAPNTLIDFLQTLPGHKIYSFDIPITSSSISNNVIKFNQTDVPYDVLIGDYICTANETIIPQLPPDFHNVLAERTGARILAAIGDQAGLQYTNTKIAEMEKNQGILADNRVDGAPNRINARHSILRYQKLGTRRRV